MVTEKNRLGFTIVSIAFETHQTVMDTLAQKKYDTATVFSYEKLDLPGFRLARTKTTPIVPVKGKTIEEITKQFNKTTRNEINRTFRMPDLTFETIVDVKDKHAWYAVYKDFELAQHRPPMPQTSFEELIIFGARLHGEPVSAVACVAMPPMLRVHSIFSKRLEVVDNQGAYATVGYASKRVMFEVIQYALREGYDGVDLAYARADQSGISNYKMSFGGTLVPEYRYEHKTASYVFVSYFAHWWGRMKWLRDAVVHALSRKSI